MKSRLNKPVVHVAVVVLLRADVGVLVGVGVLMGVVVGMTTRKRRKQKRAMPNRRLPGPVTRLLLSALHFFLILNQTARLVITDL